MESKFSGSLPEIVHKGKCVKDPGGGPFCVLCGAFSGQMEASEVSGLEIGQWHQLQRYTKLLNYTLVVLGFLPVAFIFLDNIYGWTGLSYFDYHIPSRRGPNFNDKYIDFLTPMYLLFIATMIVNWSYIDRRYIQAVGKYPSSGLIAMKLVVYWVFLLTDYAVCYPYFMDSRKYLMPRPWFSNAEIVAAYNRVYLALLFLIVGYGLIMSTHMLVNYYVRFRIKQVNDRVVAMKRDRYPRPRFEEGWG